ncbi:MAG: elongation factor G [Pseudomonadota bacterium]|nr:elongation factor G [Pseudomonadota bacterium]
MKGTTESAPRAVALVGPYLSGKTSLLESLLHKTGATGRKGTIKDGNTVGDASPEARNRQMSVEINVATTEYKGEKFAFIDCPGNIELIAEMQNAAIAADMAVVVCEPSIDKVLILSPIFKFLADNNIPHMVFINKIDNLAALEVDIDVMIDAIRNISVKPIISRCVPIMKGHEATGFVDMLLNRAFAFKANADETEIDIPADMAEDMQLARQEVLETLADFNDDIMAKLLEEEMPEADEIFAQLAKSIAACEVVPVLVGSGEADMGIKRLLKTLRHDTPEINETTERLGIEPKGKGMALVFKTVYAAHSGKINHARVMHGEVTEGMSLSGARVGALTTAKGAELAKLAKGVAGDTVALGRMESIRTGYLLTDADSEPKNADCMPEIPQPVFSKAVHAAKRQDDVKLSGALAKIVEEDPSLTYEQVADMAEMVLRGQGDVHLLIAMDRMKNKYNIDVQSRKPRTPYRESIRKSTNQHARYKKQSGGHGQFADITIDIKPRPRGQGFSFTDVVVGGAVPKQYIPAVENGVREFLNRGPLGFPVIDVEVMLTTGQFHAVDSSEMAFKTVGRMAMSEGMPKCDPILLEPIMEVAISVPSEFTSKIQRVISGARGQILGFDAKSGWDGWDEIKANMPQAEMDHLIIEIRSLTMGIGTYGYKFDRLMEISGRIAEQVVAERREFLDEQRGAA